MKTSTKCLLFCLGGFSAGALVTMPKTVMGTLLIDETDSEKDVYRIEIDNLDKLKTKKKVILKVKIDSQS